MKNTFSVWSGVSCPSAVQACSMHRAADSIIRFVLMIVAIVLCQLFAAKMRNYVITGV